MISKKRKRSRNRKWTKTEIIALIAVIVEIIFRILELLF